MTVFGRVLMFLSSYVPLFALLAVEATKRGDVAPWVFAGLAGLGLLSFAIVVAATFSRQKDDIVVDEVHREHEQVAGYVASYILPLVTLQFETWQDDVVLGGFIALIGVIYVQANLIHLNPLLPLVNLRIFRIRYHTNVQAEHPPTAEAFVVVRGVPEVGKSMSVRMLGTDIAVERR
jgi:hypothetical protein